MARKLASWVLVGLVALLLLLAPVYLTVEAQTTSREANMASRLSNINDAIVLYRQQHARFPESLDAVDVVPVARMDPLSNAQFVYTMPSDNGRVAPVVVQPISYRTKMWPFGRVRRFALYSSGEIADWLGQPIE